MASTETISPAKQSSSERLEGLALPLLFIIACLLYLPGLGSYGPLDPTDSFFIEGARELFETKQYLLPMFNYQIWLDKPILYFWLVVACYKILGVSAFAGRLASALSAVATGLVIYAGAKRTLGIRQAFAAALIFLSFPLVSVIGHESLTDMTLTFLMTSALLGFYNYLSKPSWPVIILAYLALGLAFLCKGPVAVVIVAAIVFLYFCALADYSDFKSFVASIWQNTLRLRPFSGLGIMLAVNLPWYTAATLQTKGAFLYAFFITQNFGRMAGKVNHIEPFWYYIPVIAGGLFPLNLILFSRYDAFVSAIKNRKASGDKPQALVFFALVWALLVLVLFGAIKTKLATYILPAMPPLAMLTAYSLFYWLKVGSAKKLAPSALFFIIAGIAGLVVPHVVKASWVMVMLREQSLLLILTIIVGIAYGLLLLKNKAIPAFALLLLSAAVGVGICVPVGHRVFYNEVHRPFEVMIEKVIADQAMIATVVTEEPSISYFLHRHIDVLNTPLEARAYLERRQLNGSQLAPHYVLVPQKCLKDMEWFPAGAVELSKIRKWTLFKLN
ncbi:MAG: glycosyltransferase family 39 protein [Cyanobacteria bacterium REEB67]|nr:glycosyltransferase family 39 protein [Cyanobacteria bacterium REEB67]